MASLAVPEKRTAVDRYSYQYCATHACPVVYFDSSQTSVLTTKDLRVRIGWKSSEAPITLCYCFGHTLESIRQELLTTGTSTVERRIREDIQAGRCRCEFENPSGNCCLGEVGRAVQGILAKAGTPKSTN